VKDVPLFKPGNFKRVYPDTGDWSSGLILSLFTIEKLKPFINLGEELGKIKAYETYKKKMMNPNPIMMGGNK